MSDQFSIEQIVSYGIGRQMGEQLMSQPFPGMSIEAVLDGLADMLNGKEPVIPEPEIEAAFRELSAKLQAAQAGQSQVQSAAGQEFLDQNAKRDGVQVTASGLQYEVLQQGTGAVPVKSSTVRTHYHGTLIDGTVFDSSYQRGTPAEFPVSGVIAGWTEALQMMPVGSKWRLFLPHELAYGERGAGRHIAPFSTLVFDVELLDIVG
jgi:FKBP-type peptidyl-prolyl cis-trans isomerase FklB